MPDPGNNAPGWPGIPPRWTSSAKSGVGTSLNPASRVWFTLSHGIINEVYYSRVDQACTRDLGLIITGGKGFFSEEKRHASSEVSYLAEGVPAYRLVNTCLQGSYRIEKHIITDPYRDVVLQRTRFVPLDGALKDFHLYVLLAPHLGNRGSGNTAVTGDYKGVPMLMAKREGNALALACSAPWLKRSAGFVGFSDGWQDLSRNKVMTWEYEKAEDGNVALTGEVDLMACGGEFVLSLGFGRTYPEAGNRALASLVEGFDTALGEYTEGWQEWCNNLGSVFRAAPGRDGLYKTSPATIRIHEDKRFPGGIIASLAIPWGFNKGDDDLGGYHLVWSRDLVEAAGGLLAAGARGDVHRVLHYLQVTQEQDGQWPQNMWLDGTPYWGGSQMDETAFPILLVDMARRERALEPGDLSRLWPMVRRAASFLAKNGPVTQQDRWEEDPGYSPFTLAVEVAALLAAADLAEQNGDPGTAGYLRETADVWNGSIERWTYVTGTDMAGKAGVEGYYVRIAPPEEAEAASPAAGFVPIKNRPIGQSDAQADHIISPDALALVRFGLRAPDDPRIKNTARVIDTLLRVDTPVGPGWRRYNGDGYGEHEDGGPFDGTGDGRIWPLLVGERAHYELAAGNTGGAETLMKTMAAFVGDGWMFPEQVWDAPDIPEKELFMGRPSGSAMPLVWAHSEYIKLVRSISEGRVFDMPPQTVQRYQKDRVTSNLYIWRYNHKCRMMPRGRTLRIEVLAPAMVHWSQDGWRTAVDLEAGDKGLGIYVADLDTNGLPEGSTVSFTFMWHGPDRWEGADFCVQIGPAEAR